MPPVLLGQTSLKRQHLFRVAPGSPQQVQDFFGSFFQGFRFSQAYSRWWEARILWGIVVNESRNWLHTLIKVLPRQASIGMRHRLLEVWVLLV